MQVTERCCLLFILSTSLVLVTSCSHRSHPIVFHTQSSKVDHSDSTWSEPIWAGKGQTLKASYSLSISEGTWAIWFTQAGKSEPHYLYSAYDSDYAGSIEYRVPESGKYVLQIESKNLTGSYDVTMSLKK